MQSILIAASIAIAAIVAALLYVDRVIEAEYKRLFPAASSWPVGESRKSSRWSDMSEAEKRAASERDCG